MHRCPLIGRGLALSCASLALAVAPLAAYAAPISAIPRASAPASSAVIAGVPRASVRDAGRAPAQTLVRLAIGLRIPDQPKLEAFVRAVADPGSPIYHRFLTARQFADTFAPSADEYARYAATLQRLGLTVTKTYPTRTLIDVAAPAGVVERVFSTEIHLVDQPGAGRRYANARPAFLPAELRAGTSAVVGFDNIVLKTHNVRANGARRPNAALGPPLQGPDTGLGPFALATAYDFPVQHSLSGGPTFDGTGHAAAIVIDSDVADSDVNAFLAYFNVNRTGPPLARVIVDGGGGFNGDGIETALDAETISSLAPGAAVYLYLTPDLSTTSVVDAYTKTISDGKVDAVNSSFGGCEVNDGGFGALSDQVALQGAAVGVTFAASSGDLGADQCIGTVPNFVGVSTPANAPHFVAVGGTSLLLNQNGSYRAEVAWNQSGGGVSTVFPLPPYQTGIAGVVPGGRNVPDVSFDADPGTGMSLYYDAAFIGPIGGTSLSSPMFVAFLTEINQFRHGRSGFLNPGLYTIFKRTGYTHFRDIIYGSNALFGGGYNAGPGYDAVTGIGTPIGWPL